MICGLVSKARCGKDTFGGYLIECFKERHNRDFVQMAFATRLKEMCKEQFGLSDDQLWESGKNIRETPDKRFIKLPPEALMFSQADSYWTPREIMQELGSFYRRIDYNFWVKHLNLYLISNDIKDVIITDVRHVNECEYVKANKGVLIKITRDSADKIHGMDHESETALDDKPEDYFDIEINNCGTLKDLYVAAEDSSDAIIMVENMMKRGRSIKNGKE
jgi:hypothetical protein